MQSVTASTKELMEELISFEEHETMKMVQATNRFEDM
jgi:ATP-dependent 26S proteasome regulatory subunit